MSQFFVGELGYEHDAAYGELAVAENHAVELSIASGTDAIVIADGNDEVLSVVVEGEIFDKRKT